MDTSFRLVFDIVDKFRDKIISAESLNILYSDYVNICKDITPIAIDVFDKILSVWLLRKKKNKVVYYTKDLSSIYFISDYKKQYVKIGKSNYPASRLRELQTGSPLLLQVSYIFRNAGGVLELQLHRLFKKYNMHHEWFIFNDDIKLIAEKYNNRSNVTIDNILNDLGVIDNKDIIIYGNIEDYFVKKSLNIDCNKCIIKMR